MLRKKQEKINKKPRKRSNTSKTKMDGFALKHSNRKNPMISLTLETPLGLSERVGGMENLLKLLLEYIVNRGSSQGQGFGAKYQGKKLSITNLNKEKSMPLVKGKSKKDIRQNIVTEMKIGKKPRKQAIAIALNQAAKSGSKPKTKAKKY